MNSSRRSCDGCTACCEGWLSANIHGHDMYPGKPCHFVSLGKGCTIYKDRPKNPCVGYQCAWIADEDNFLPEWLKPSESGIIITPRNWNVKGQKQQLTYWNVTETGKEMSATILFWLITFAEQNNISMEISVNKITHVRGPPEFHEFINNMRNNRK